MLKGKSQISFLSLQMTWEQEKGDLKWLKGSWLLEEVSDAVIYMLKRPRTVTIRDMIILPTNFDI